MDTRQRLSVYQANGNKHITPRQRRRLVKKAATDPGAVVVRDDGMGYPPNKQGFRELIFVAPGPAPDKAA